MGCLVALFWLAALLALPLDPTGIVPGILFFAGALIGAASSPNSKNPMTGR